MISSLFVVLLIAFIGSIRAEDSDARIFGGFETPIDAFPAIVSLRFYNPPGQTAPIALCAGSILSDIFVLTTASCFSGIEAFFEFFSIQAGVYDRTNVSETTEQIRSISHVIVHPMYNATLLINDLALVRVFPPFDFNESSVANLPLANATDLTGLDLIAIGWGIVNQSAPTVGATTLQQVTVQEDQQCTKDKAIDPSTQLCASGKTTELSKRLKEIVFFSRHLFP